MEHHTKMDAEQYDCINRKLSVYDIELGARDVVLRLDLDIPLSKFTPPVKANEGVSAKSLEQPPASVGRDSKVNAKKSELDSAISGNPLGPEEDSGGARWAHETQAHLHGGTFRRCVASN